jgi:hypothetical protein
MPIPSIVITAVGVLPKMAYPTVVKVATLHHMISGIDENLSAWTSCST